MQGLQKIHFIKVNTAILECTGDRFPVLVFIWLEYYNVKRLIDMRSIQYYSKKDNCIVITELNKLSSKMASIAIQDKKLKFASLTL